MESIVQASKENKANSSSRPNQIPSWWTQSYFRFILVVDSLESQVVLISLSSLCVRIPVPTDTDSLLRSLFEYVWTCQLLCSWCA